MTRIKNLPQRTDSRFLTAARMRALEGAAIASGRVTGAVLMARAFSADLVVTSHAAKPEHAVLEDLGARVVFVEIGL